MLDIATAYNRYKFLGHEFLTWLWYLIETDGHRLGQIDPPSIVLSLGKRIVLENPRENHAEKITIKGEYANFEAGILPLRQGSLVTELSLEAKSAEMTWAFNLKGESLSVSTMKMSTTGPIESLDDVEGALLEKVYLLETILQFIDTLFERFFKMRVSNDWDEKVVPQIRKWIIKNEVRQNL
ncbi:hypothetical protein ACFL2E_03165 [Thermodesulfobacteriota bacterium]